MIRILRTFLRPYGRALLLAIALLLVQALGNLYLPELNAVLIDEGVARGDIDRVLEVGLAMLAATLAVGLASIAGAYWAARIAMGFGRDLRGAIFASVQTFSQREVARFGAPSLITRNTNDVQQVQMVVLMGLTVLVSAPLTAIGGVIMALRQDVPLSGLLVVIVPLMGAVVGLSLSRALPLFRRMQERIDRLNLVGREMLAGIRVIRAFVRTGREEERFARANGDLTSTALAVNRLFAVVMPAVLGLMNVSAVAVLWFGALRVESGDMAIGELTAFLAYILQILMSVLMAVIMFVMVPRAAASAERIVEVLDTQPSVRDPERPATSPAGRRGTIEFRDVTFGYPGAEEPVIRGVSFTAGPGEVTAIVGSTGSGKSTLVNLAVRFYDVTGGAILVDGVDIRELRREDLWSRIGLVPQKAFLFSGTVASNLRYGDAAADDAALWRALEIAQAREFVEAMAGGLAAEIDQGGTNLSGGQRQRLAIARAVVRRPEIHVFDDSFSALDYATDARLRAALAAETRDATVLIVAQRVGTIRSADRIVVLEDGAVVGIGRHRELLDSCPTYREIVLSQLTEEEAA
ncbi:MAG: hypothetical protein RL338_1244 [Chloroflexota bacterium]